MKIINTEGKTWGRASKSGTMYVRPLESVIQPEFLDHFKLVTLEGMATLRHGSTLCKGATGEMWCQELSGVLEKYNLETSRDGWSKCVPKPENQVEFFFSTENGWLQGQWGEDVPGVGTNLQEISVGDAVCRNPKNITDQWVVRFPLFERTYAVL